MKLSISTKLYFNYTLEETIKRVANINYPGIEIWGGRPHAYYKDMSGEFATSINKLIEKLAVQISGFIPAQFGYPTCICSPVSSIRKDSVEYLKRSIDTSLLLGCNKVSICPGRTLYGQGYDHGMVQLTSSLNELVDYAIKKDVLLLLEPAHMYESDLILTIEEGLRIIEEQKYEHLGIALDTGHCHINKESLVDCVLMLQNKKIPVHIHIDDNNGLTDQHKIPGEGNINFVPFLKTLIETGYEGFLVVELGFDYTTEPDAAAIRSKKIISSLLKEASEYILPSNSIT
jgi:fructoselysine 3-epimerase